MLSTPLIPNFGRQGNRQSDTFYFSRWSHRSFSKKSSVSTVLNVKKWSCRTTQCSIYKSKTSENFFYTIEERTYCDRSSSLSPTEFWSFILKNVNSLFPVDPSPDSFVFDFSSWTKTFSSPLHTVGIWVRPSRRRDPGTKGLGPRPRGDRHGRGTLLFKSSGPNTGGPRVRGWWRSVSNWLGARRPPGLTENYTRLCLNIWKIFIIL